MVQAGGQALRAPELGGCCPSWVRTQHFCFFGKSIFDSLVVLQAHEDSCSHARRATLGQWFCQGQQPPPLNSVPMGGEAPATISLGSEQAFRFTPSSLPEAGGQAGPLCGRPTISVSLHLGFPQHRCLA